MSRVVLTLRAAPPVPVEAPCVRPDELARHGEREIAQLPVWLGNAAVPLGELFEVRGGRSAEVVVRGETGRVKHLGSGMVGGRLLIEGPAGAHTGAEMRGGHLRVLGRVGDWAGAEMEGGVLEVHGDAGDGLAAAYPGSRRGMRGGVALVHGSAGAQAGAWMRRGLVAVGGYAGGYAGAHLTAGTVVVLGRPGPRPGLGMRRGSLIAGGEVEPLPTFRVACVYRPGFLPLYLRRLREVHGLAVEAAMIGGAYRRLTGDHADLGRGEILAWERE